MDRRLVVVFAIVFTAIGTAAIAQERLNEFPLGLRASFQSSETGPTLRYADEGCWWECTVAIVRCPREEALTISFIVPQESLAQWLLAEPADGAVAAPLRANLRLGDHSAPIYLTSILYGEFEAAWWAEVESTHFTNADFAALATASLIAITSPAFELELSPAIGDPEAREAFVDACLAM